MGTDTINKMRGWLLVGAMFLTIVGFTLIGYKYGFHSAVKGEVKKVDTLYLRDTIVQYEPILEERIVIKKEYVPVVQQDTIWRQDTLYVAMNREQVVWQDSLSKVYASGIQPQVDSVQHYIEERVITREVVIPKVKKTRWGIGIHAGYGVQFGEQIRTAPYIGVGVSYNILSW